MGIWLLYIGEYNILGAGTLVLDVHTIFIPFHGECHSHLTTVLDISCAQHAGMA